MNTTAPASPPFDSTAQAVSVRFSTEIELNAFHWLLLLGFSVEDAAAAVRPDTFTR